jgi:ribosomal protein S18 acetylase RimI-like enzyme
MPKLEIQPLADEHLDAAARLLAERHEAHRRAEPLLPAEVDFRAEVGSLFAAGASGAVAVRKGDVVGYLLGTHRENPVWGPNVWVELAGHAVREAEIVRDLYAAGARDWVERGWTRHYALVPASERDLLDAWFRLSFGAQHALGIREVPADQPPGVPRVSIREADERDLDALIELAPLLGDHQAVTPVFGAVPRPSDEEIRADVADDLASDRVANLVAEIDDRIVANFVVCPLESSDMHSGLARPHGASFLGFAVTLPEARGSGAGVALTDACFAWARGRGYEVMSIDWRETNLLASRFWPARGFRRTFQRLYRSIP